MRKVTSDRPRRLAWDLVERPKDSDFAVDIGLLSHSRRDIQEKADLVDRTAHTVGLKSHPAKTKFLKVKSRPRKPDTVRGKELNEVQDFKYLGSFISTNSNVDREVTGDAAQAFRRLEKIKFYNSNVRFRPMYAAET